MAPVDLPRIWFDAQAEHEGQIDGLEAETNMRRSEARAIRGRKGG